MGNGTIKTKESGLFKKVGDFFDSSLATKIIFGIGFFIRFIAFLLTNTTINQHDVIPRYGHFDYAVYMFKNWNLPNAWVYEFAQPPLNAISQALVMKFLSLFKDYSSNYLELFSYTKILMLIWTSLTLIIIYKMLDEFDIPRIMKNTVLLIMALYPGQVILTTQYSNDAISYMFFYLSLYLTVKWCKNKKLSTIILLALSIGFGMLAKISVGLIAFITGPMMIVIWIRSLMKPRSTSPNSVGASSTSPSITLQLIIFGLIVFPIGLSFSIRNYIMFDTKFGAIAEIAIGTLMAMKYWSWTLVDRFLSLPIDRIVETKINVEKLLIDVSKVNVIQIKPFGIYHSKVEYNVWIDLIKTATFDEFYFKDTIWHPLCVVLYAANYIFHALGLVTIVLNIKDVIKDIRNIGSKCSDPVLNLKIMSIMLFILAIAAYVGFNYKYPYSCNSNYRYIAYITLAFAISIAIKCLQKRLK